jgi:hypothetical protein
VKPTYLVVKDEGEGEWSTQAWYPSEDAADAAANLLKIAPADVKRAARETVIRALTQLNPRFALYREQDAAFREQDVNFWTEVIESVLTASHFQRVPQSEFCYAEGDVR